MICLLFCIVGLLCWILIIFATIVRLLFPFDRHRSSRTALNLTWVTSFDHSSLCYLKMQLNKTAFACCCCGPTRMWWWLEWREYPEGNACLLSACSSICIDWPDVFWGDVGVPSSPFNLHVGHENIQKSIPIIKLTTYFKYKECKTKIDKNTVGS